MSQDMYYIGKQSSTQTVPVNKGGTGTTELASGEILLGNGAEPITSIATLPVAKGGTGTTELASGEILLGNGTSAITSTATLPVAKGGTGGTTASVARTNLDVLHATQLYSNNSATTGTITLSDTVTKYSFLEIYFRNKGVYSVKIVPKKDVSVLSTAIIGGGSSAADATLDFYTAIVNISGTTITFSPYHSGFMKGTEQNTYYNTNTPGIIRVIGYSY